MKSLQTQYNLIKEGKGNKEVFIKSAKAQFPTIPNHYGFNETVNELKHKNILNETMLGIVSAQSTTPDWFKIFNESVNEAKSEEKKPTKEVVDMETRGFDYKDKKNIDNVYGEEFLKGFYTEMQDPKNEDKTVEELKSIVAKNLAKDQLHYVKDGQFGIKGIGYSTEHPGLGTPKEAKGKYKSSGYGDLKEGKYKKEGWLVKSNNDDTKYIAVHTSDVENKANRISDIYKDKKLAIKKADELNKKLRESETRSVGSMVKPEGFQVGDKVKFRGMNHEITRIIDDRIYIKSLRYGRRPEVWVKAVDLKKSSLKENKSNPEVDKLLKVMNTKKAGSEYKKALMDLIAMAEKKSNKTINTKKEALLALDYIEPTIKENENTLMDIENQLLDANIGDMAYGGGYGPFEKVTRNTWKNTKTGSLQHSRKLTEFIGGFSDFRISSSTNESKLRSAIHQFIKEELNRGKL
jgi:hypothetical protein